MSDLLSRGGVGDVRTADAPGTTAAHASPAEQVASDLPLTRPPAPVLAAVLRARLAWQKTQPQLFLTYEDEIDAAARLGRVDRATASRQGGW